MNIYMTAFAALLLWVPVLADDASARAQLIGAWQQQDASGKGIFVWVVETKGNALRITNSQGIRNSPKSSADQELSVKEPLRERSLT
jgi:hypothetical protein